MSSSCWICFTVADVCCLQVVGFVSEFAVVCCLQVDGFVSELQSYVVFKLMDLFQSCSRMLSSSCWICFRVAVVCCVQVVGFVSELQSYVVFKLLDLF